ncbi:MAG: methyltransferase domain-containing protein [Ramlibacter sp.]
MPAAAVPHPWDLAAEGWNRHSELVNRWLQEATGAMLDAAGIAPGYAVLDVAAGAGGQTLDIARRVGSTGRVLATDISPRILALAAANARAAGLAHVETRVADAQSLGLKGAGFDAAVCRLGLMFCTEPLRAVAGMAAALRSGGRMAAMVFSQPQVNPSVAILMTTAVKHAGLAPGSPFAPGSLLSLGRPGLLQELLQEAGFADVKVLPIAAPMRLPTAAHYLEFVRSAGSPIMQILAPLPQAAQQAAWDDMAAQLERFAGPDGWMGPNELLLCSGRTP